MTTNIETMLQGREQRYGTFPGHAEISQHLKTTIRRYLCQRDQHLAADQDEALEMICHKIARIINGDPDYVDNWVDIAGYATLVAHRLECDQRSVGN